MILLSPVGTGNYDEVEYFRSSPASDPIRTRFAPVATARFLSARQAVLFVTAEAESPNGAALRAELEREGVETKFVRIPAGGNEEEIWEIIARIFQSVPDRAEVGADVTHAFRHLPMLMLAALSFLTARKQVGVRGIFYGAREARVGERVPMIDLAPFLTLLDGFHAARQFADSGDARRIAAILKELNTALYKEQRGEAQFSRLAEQLRKTSEALVCALPLETGIHARRSLESLARARQGAAANRPVVRALFEMVEGPLRKFAVSDAVNKQRISLTLGELDRQFRIVRFLAKQGNRFQALLLLREWFISRCLLARGGDDWLDYEKSRSVMERQLNALSERARTAPAACPDPQRELASLWDSLKSRRNALAHAGMNANEVATDPGWLEGFLDRCAALRDQEDGWDPRPVSESCALVTAFGLSPGVLCTALRSRYRDCIGSVFVVTSQEAGPRLEEACREADWDTSRLEKYIAEDPFHGFEEHKQLIEKWKPRLALLGRLIVNITGGTTAMQYLVEKAGREAERMGLAVERIALIDRRSPREQQANPYVLGEVVPLESVEPAPE